MSHTLSLQLSVTDLEALQAACPRVGAQYLGAGVWSHYSKTCEGYGLKLAGWRYPVVIDQAGGVHYDNFEGRWGKIQRLNDLVAYYGLEAARSQAVMAGHSCYETIQDGELVLTVQVGV